MKKSVFSDFCAKQEPPNSLQALLICPVQRIPRYMLLLKELSNKTPEDHPDSQNLIKALQKIQELADSVNANIKQAEQRRNVEDLIEGIPGIAVR
jgi:hypothetical protein